VTVTKVLVVVFHPEFGVHRSVHPVRAGESAHHIEGVLVALDPVPRFWIDSVLIEVSRCRCNLDILERAISCHKLLEEESVASHNVSNCQVVLGHLGVIRHAVTESAVEHGLTVGGSGGLIGTAALKQALGLGAIGPVDICFVVVLGGAATHLLTDFHGLNVLDSLLFHEGLD